MIKRITYVKLSKMNYYFKDKFFYAGYNSEWNFSLVKNIKEGKIIICGNSSDRTGNEVKTNRNFSLNRYFYWWL